MVVVVSNETWTRQRNYNLQMEDSPVCFCQGSEREREEPDTIHHRKFSCQGIEKVEGYKKSVGLKITYKGSIWVSVAKDGKCGSRLG